MGAEVPVMPDKPPFPKCNKPEAPSSQPASSKPNKAVGKAKAKPKSSRASFQTQTYNSRWDSTTRPMPKSSPKSSPTSEKAKRPTTAARRPVDKENRAPPQRKSMVQPPRKRQSTLPTVSEESHLADTQVTRKSPDSDIPSRIGKPRSSTMRASLTGLGPPARVEFKPASRKNTLPAPKARSWMRY